MKARRLSQTDDLSPAIELLQRFFREENFSTPDGTIAMRVQQMASLDACAVLVVEEDETTIAVATVSLEFGIEFGWSAEMGDLYVLPEWRSRGVSRLLIGAVEEFLRLRGVSRYQVTLTPFGADERNLTAYYAALGFSTDGRLIHEKYISG